MSDIKKDIAKDFRELTSGNAKIKELSKKLEAGKASYLDADSLALELATALGKALHNNLGNDQLVGEDYKALMREVLPAGLHDIYEDVADYAVTIQRGIYLRQNIGLRVAPPDFNTVEVDEITGKATMVDSYKEIPGGLTNDIQHMAQNVATDTMDKNARLAREVGYEPVVTRVYDRIGVHTQNGGKYRKDCQWCLSRCGTDVPYGEAKSKDMFRRHPGCKCRIEYTVNGKTQVQTDWTRNQWRDVIQSPSSNGAGLPGSSGGNRLADEIIDGKRAPTTGLLGTLMGSNQIDFNRAEHLKGPLSTLEIIDKVGGGDMTNGSCASVALAYIANKHGLDVMDFRGGGSQLLFSRGGNISQIIKMVGGESFSHYNGFKSANALLARLQEGKEYFFCAGQHSAIVRKGPNGLEYLELQTNNSNGFKPLDSETLKKRFGVASKRGSGRNKVAFNSYLADVDLFKNNPEFEVMMGYINTSPAKQMKGATGRAK